MWLIKYVFCAFLLSHVILTNVTCEENYEFEGNENEDTSKFSTDPTPDNILTLKKLVQSATENLVRILLRPKTTDVKNEIKSHGFFKSNNNYSDSDYKEKETVSPEKESKKAILPQHKSPFTPRKFIQYDDDHKMENDESANDYNFNECEENESVPPEKESKKATTPQYKNRFTPRKFIQYDDNNKMENDALNLKLKTKPKNDTSVVYYISEDDKSNYSNYDQQFELTLYNMLLSEPKYFLEIANLMTALLKGNDIRHLEDFNVLPHLSQINRDALDTLQKQAPYVTPKTKEIISNDLELGAFRSVKVESQMLQNEIPIGRAMQFRLSARPPSKNTIVIVVPPKKLKNIKVDEFTDVEYDIQREGLILFPTNRAFIKMGWVESETVFVTYYPSGKQFLLQEDKIFTCDGYIAEETKICVGKLKPFVPTKVEDNCYLNNFPKALGHVCLSKSGKDVFMFYREGRLICQTDADDVQHMTYEDVNKLCSKVASRATYQFREYSSDESDEEIGIRCTQNHTRVCQLNESLVLSEDSKIPLNF